LQNFQGTHAKTRFSFRLQKRQANQPQEMQAVESVRPDFRKNVLWRHFAARFGYLCKAHNTIPAG
jgi:hypothetical protein